SPHSKQVGLGLSLIALPVQYQVKWPTWLHRPHTENFQNDGSCILHTSDVEQHTGVAIVLAPEQLEQSSF
ncbi:hypothetical protein Tco_0069858, partial [Tanacetum coccineum]